MSFWHTITGPAPERLTVRSTGPTATAPRALVGELVCPACNAVVVRLVDEPGGCWLEAWVPHAGVAQRTEGWGYTCGRPLEADGPDRTTVHCRQGHSVEIDLAILREIEAAYRATGRRRRRPGRAML